MKEANALVLAIPKMIAFKTASGSVVIVGRIPVETSSGEPFLYDNTNQKIEDSNGELILVNSATAYTSAYTAAQIDAMAAAGG